MGLQIIGLALLIFSCKGKDSVVGPGADLGTCPEPAAVQMRRLSADQYANTVWAAVDFLGGQSLTLALGDTLTSRLNAVPTDALDGKLSREDQAITQSHADAWYTVAAVVADTAIDPDHFDAVFNCDSAACVPDFVEDVVSRLARRRLNDEEVSFYVDEVYDGAPTHVDGMRDVLLVALASPYFAHQIEHGSDAEGDLVTLTAHELASRLSFHFWGEPPDDELWTAASDGSLLDDAVYQAQVARIFADERTADQLETFFSDWLELDELASMNQLVGDPKYDAFTAGFEPSAQLTDDIREDALGLVRWHLANGGTLDDLWTSDLNTAPSEEVARIYGSTVWDGASTPQSLGTGVHAGLLTRPAFTASGLPSTRPIHKGVLIRKRILCDDLGSPPADIGGEPDVDPLSSTRERTEALTEIPDSSCSGCHTYINGLGYASENFDGLGRVRTSEPIYDEDGQRIGEAPVVTQGTPRVEMESDQMLMDSVELADALAATSKTDVCVARFWFRHTYGQAEDLASDRCAIQSVSEALSQGQPLADGLRAIALDPSFKLRKFDNSPAGETL